MEVGADDDVYAVSVLLVGGGFDKVAEDGVDGASGHGCVCVHGCFEGDEADVEAE